jgi:DUF4097 and DUF4098 domain-containing protein YvlB
MKKQEFFNELRTRLAGTDETLRDEICSDIDEHFQEGYAHGLTEEEICRNLGQPGTIAEQILEEYKEKPIKAEAAQRTDKPADNDFIKQGPFGGSYYDIDIDKRFTDVKDVKIKLNTNNLIIKPDNQSQHFRVTIRGRSRYNKFNLESIAGELNIIEDRPVFVFEIFNVITKLETTLWVPSYFSGDINAAVSNGEINVTGVQGNMLNLKNSVSSSYVSNCRFNEYAVHSSAGKVEMNKCDGNKILIKASAGSVTVEETSGALEVQASAGNVHIFNKNQKMGKVKVDASAGSVKLEALETQELHLYSAAGSIKAMVEKLNGDAWLNSSAGSVKFETRSLAGNIDAQSAVGSIKLLLPDGSVKCFNVNSTMGSVKNKLQMNNQSPYTVKATSQMGSVKIEPV